MKIQDVPLPDDSLPEYAWQIRWGRRVGQRVIGSGVAQESDPVKASALFHRKADELHVVPDIKINRDGYDYVRDIRTGKYVEKRRVEVSGKAPEVVPGTP